ncbi:uncharacterized protein LOC130671204 [Microplitis mediator]|uniref:uncharacterized protein LOC130671204 n=1 Tax=Microplitis mediator TaxID=375433 RepID=UPI0025527608|nr:uncharacterized protein LOC130671204 [Microplitis mediator]XP_057330918.1 uncharacterized protein LOC130671204 [Microplitis mediator]XP_057330919.1 uncharacterized protein LOC130671204 [Microplitis mediator]
MEKITQTRQCKYKYKSKKKFSNDCNTSASFKRHRIEDDVLSSSTESETGSFSRTNYSRERSRKITQCSHHYLKKNSLNNYPDRMDIDQSDFGSNNEEVNENDEKILEENDNVNDDDEEIDIEVEEAVYNVNNDGEERDNEDDEAYSVDDDDEEDDGAYSVDDDDDEIYEVDDDTDIMTDDGEEINEVGDGADITTDDDEEINEVSDEADIVTDDDEVINEVDGSDAEQLQNDNAYPKWKESYKNNVDIDTLTQWIMFKASNVSVFEVLNMITAITVRFGLADEIQQAILELTKFLAGPDFKNLDTSKYLMRKIFNPPTNAVLHVFYCEQCSIPLAKPITKEELKKIKKKKCDKCETEYDLSTSKENFFISINLEYQLKSLLANQSMRIIIDKQLEKNSNNNNDKDTISDICDSNRYISDDFIKSKIDDGDIVLSLNVNTDGAPLFKSSRHSFWPIQCVINEVPILLRHKIVLLAGLWYTSAEPKPQFMNLYMHTFMKQISNLMTDGIEIMTEHGIIRKYFCKIFSFPLDSVARPVVQNRLQFNGSYGCSWCYQQSVYKSRATRYPFKSTKPEIRNHEKYLKDVENCENNKKKLPKTKKNEHYTFRGIKGPCILSSLPGFDCIWGFPHDYMHAVLLGVTRQLWNTWSSEFLTVKKRKIINERLINIKPPNEIHRVPRALQKKKSWKATEWRSWLLFYSVPILTEILNQELLESYKLFVKSVQKLLSSDISEEDLLTCETDLLQFVYDCQRLYGDSFMTFNIHSLQHMVQSVRENGPASCNSAYPFENNIYNLKKKVTSPKGVSSQMSNRSLRHNMFVSKLNTAPDDPSWLFCKTILNKRKEVTKKFIKTDDGVVLIKDSKEDSTDTLKKYYSRCVYNNTMYHSKLYTKTKKTNNRIVRLEGDRIAEINCFYELNNLSYIEANILTVEPFDGFEHIYRVTNWENEQTIAPVTEIVSKLIFIQVRQMTSSDDKTNNDYYVCINPNNYEVQ